MTQTQTSKTPEVIDAPLAKIVPSGQLLAPAEWESKLELVKSQCCKPSKREASADEFGLFMHVARTRRLDPLSRQIYAVFRWDTSLNREKMCIQTGIDGYRLAAQRTGEYRGQTKPEWCGEDGKWGDVWLKNIPPHAARVAVYRAGFAEVCWGVALYRSYVQTNKDGHPTGQWRNMPEHMLSKCAEALALRKAFPDELGDIYTEEEMGQADNPPPPPPNRAVIDQPVDDAGDGSGYSAADVNALVLNWSKVQPEDLPSVKARIKTRMGIDGKSVNHDTLQKIGAFVQDLIDRNVPLTEL